MYRQHISRKISPSLNRTTLSSNLVPSQSYEPLSSVVQRAQQEPENLSIKERQQLESSIGTRATQKILAGEQASWMPEFKGISGQLGGDSGYLGAPIQAKLTVGQPNDKYEQEADRVAEQVMRMPEPTIQRVCPECEDELKRQPMEEEEETLQTKPVAEQITPLVQRQAEPMEQEEEEEEMLQTKTASGQTPTLSSSLQNQITSLQGGGQPLSQSERTFFEPRFGADFSQVRIHADSQAAETAKALNARAFALGQDIVFGSGQYQPSASEGRCLLAHELAHVLQHAAPRMNSHDLTVRRRNGITNRPNPNRPEGSLGQREGQKRPWNRGNLSGLSSTGRRKPWRPPPYLFRLLERWKWERQEAARRKFEEMIRRNQEELERMGRGKGLDEPPEGTPAKTGRDRTIRSILKFWELWAELMASRDKTYESFANQVLRRVNLEKQGYGSESEYAKLDKEILRSWKTLQDFDSDLFERVIDFEARLQERRREIDRWVGDPKSQPELDLKYVLYFGVMISEWILTVGELDKKFSQLEKKLSQINYIWMMQSRITLPISDPIPKIHPIEEDIQSPHSFIEILNRELKEDSAILRAYHFLTK